MFTFRPIEQADLPALFALSEKSGTGLTSLPANARAGWLNGTPSTADVRPFSATLRRSQFSLTSMASATSVEPNTCG